MSTPLLPAMPGVVTVGSLSQAERAKRRYDAVLTLEDPSTRQNQRLRFSTRPCPDHLVLMFEDVDCESFGYAHVAKDQVEKVVAFGRKHTNSSMLVHCYHGVGRSAAAALAMLADRKGAGAEAEAVADLFAMRPESTPNLVFVKLADEVLGRQGRLMLALEEFENRYREFAVKRERRRKFAEENPHLYTRAKSF